MEILMRDFDSRAAEWDNKPRRVILARAVSDAIIKKLARTEIRTLDFGCGTGLVTLALTAMSREVVAADTSSGMLDQLDKKLADAGIDNVIPLQISEDPDENLPGGFDLVVSSMTMHHIEDVASQIVKFRQTLNPGGMLCIADLDEEDGTFHDTPEGIRHHGFSVEQMGQYFLSAGFTEITSEIVDTVIKERDGKTYKYPVILTTGHAID